MGKRNQNIVYYISNFIRLISAGSLPIYWIALIASIFLTLMIWQTYKINLHREADTDFIEVAKNISTQITKRLFTYELTLKGASGFYYSTYGNINKNKWNNYVTSLDLDRDYPGIQGIGLSEIFYKKELPNYIKKMRAEGLDSFTVRPTYDRNIYSSISFLEPQDTMNKYAIGYDMFSDPSRNEAMTFAMQNNKTAITHKVILIQETLASEKQPGFIIYYPVYANKEDSAKTSRALNIKAFVYAPFRMYDFIEGTLTNEYKEQVFLRIVDPSSPDSVLYDNIPDFSSSLCFSTIKLNLFNKTWDVYFASTPHFEDNYDFSRSHLYLWGGLSVSILIFLLSLSFTSVRAANRRQAQILATTDEGIFGIDRNNQIQFINTSALELLGYRKDEVLHKRIHKLIHYKKEDGSDYPVNECPITLSIIKNKPAIVDSEVFWKKDGTSFPVEYSAFPMLKDNYVIGAVVTFKDITERKNFLNQLEKSLNEKTVLLKEVHHRVKNNLQIISSLLNLQSAQTDDVNTRALLRESQNRVLSLALIHEKLYQTNDMSRIPFSDYLKELCDTLYRSYSSVLTNIEFDLELEEMYLSIDKSIPLGLIINEIVSNSLKHAFKTNQGTIYAKLIKHNSKVELIIGDNGVGLPKGVNLEENHSLGYKLIKSLSVQLEAELTIVSDKGTEYKLVFETSQ